MTSNEATLIRDAARGDNAAFAALMRTHRDRVYRVARRIVGSHEAAEDIAQQVFITMHHTLHSFRGRSKLSTWLYRVTVNACYDHLRRERPRVELDFERLPAAGVDPAGAAASAEAMARIAAHIQTLPPKQRTAVTLRLHEDLSFREIASVMGCSVNAAKVNYFHAIRRLRDAMRPQGVPEHAV